MRLVLLLAWRHLVFQPGRALASVLGIGLGIATVVSVLTVDHNTLLSQATRRVPSDPDADLLVQPLKQVGVDVADMAQDLRHRDFLRGVTAFARGNASLFHEARAVAGVELMAVERGANEVHAAYAVVEGQDLDFSSDEPQLLLSGGVARQTGLGVGDAVALSLPPGRRAPVTRCVDGKMVVLRPAGGGEQAARPRHPFRVVGILAPSNLGYAKRRVLAAFGPGRAVLGPEAGVRFWADFDTASLDFLSVENALRDAFVVYQPKRALAGMAPEEAAFRSGVRFCGFLALFLGLYIIFNTMSMSLVERVRHIGLLRSLGLTAGRLLGTFMVEGAVLALSGAALSLWLADRIVAFLVSMGITTLGYGKPLEITEVPWAEIGWVMGAGVLFCLLGVLYPFVRASRLSVIEALRRGVIELSADPFTGVRRSVLLGLLALVPVAWFVGVPTQGYLPLPLWEAVLQGLGLVGGVFTLLLLAPGLLPALARLVSAPCRGPAALLARLTMGTARQRVFGSVSGLMLAFAAVFLIVSVLESLKTEARRFGQEALAGRVFFRTSEAGASWAAELPGDVPALRVRSPVGVEVQGPFPVRSLDPRMLGQGSMATRWAAREAFAQEPTLLLSTRCADDFGYAAGDQVTLATAAEGPVAFRVLEVTDEYGFAPDNRVFGVVSIRTLRRYWCRDTWAEADRFVARAPDLDEAGWSAALADLRAALGPDDLLEVRRGEAIAEEYVTDLERSFAIFYAILVLTVLLSAVGILNAMVIAVMERRREIGLLRAVGLTGGQVARMLMVESGAFGVLGGLLGVLLGLPLALLTAEALTAMSHLDLRFELTPRAGLAVLAGSVVVALVSVLYPAVRARRLRLSNVMRYE